MIIDLEGILNRLRNRALLTSQELESIKLYETESERKVVTMSAELEAHKKLLEDKKKPPYDPKELEKLQKENEAKKKEVAAKEAKAKEEQRDIDDLKGRLAEMKNLKDTYESMKHINEGVVKDKAQLEADAKKAAEDEKKLLAQAEDLAKQEAEKKKELEEKERGIDDLKKIVGLIHDMNHFERKCKDLDDKLREIYNKIQDGTKAVIKLDTDHTHNKDVTDDVVLPDEKLAMDEKIRETRSNLDSLSERHRALKRELDGKAK